MKRYWKLLIAAAAVMLLCIGMLYAFTDLNRRRDILMLNDLTQTVRTQKLYNGSAGSSGEPVSRFQTALLVFNKEGVLVYSTEDAPDTIRSLPDAMQAGWLCLPVADDSAIYGTAAIPDPADSALRLARKRLLLIAAAALLVLFLTAAAIGLYLQQRIIRPFRKMRRFAETIAQGNLDEPLLTDQNDLFGPFTQSFDIMREELRAAQMRETALHQREKELIASLSHDIKTPVTGIKLICELLCVRTDDAYLTGKIRSINEKAEQIDLLAADLLNSSLDALGALNVSCRDESSAILPAIIREHDTRNLVTAGPVPECLILADKNRLSQVFGNIISNSYKYADTPIEVHFSFEGAFLAVSVTDHGSSLSPGELELITQKYYRGGNADGKDGTGLGLYISASLMEKMNGKLLCTSDGNGLTVTVLIPLS